MALVPWPTHGRRISQKVDECRVRAREVVPDCLLPEQHWLQAGGSLVTISHSHRGKTGFPSYWYDMKVRGILGRGSSDDEEVTILGRRLRWRRYQNHRVRG